MEEPEVQTGFVTQADLKLLRDQVDQLQVILTEPRKPWYLEGSTLTSALAVLVALISFFFSTYQGDQKELREKREEFRSVLEKLVSMSEEDERLRTDTMDRRERGRRRFYLLTSRDLYRSSAEMLAQDLGPNVLFSEYLIMGDQFAEGNNHIKASGYYEKSLEASVGLVERNQAHRKMAWLQNSLLLNNVAKMRHYFNQAIDDAKGEDSDLMRFTAGNTFVDWAKAEQTRRNYIESLDKLELAEQIFLKMSDEDGNKPRSLDSVKHRTGLILWDMAELAKKQGNYMDYTKRLDQAEQAFLKMSEDDDDNNKQELLSDLRRLRPISLPWWASAPTPSLGPAPLWRSPLLDDAIKNLGREAPASGSRGTQP